MSGFAQWLMPQSSAESPELHSLKGFAKARAEVWPYHSDLIDDYVQVVASATPDADRAALLSTLFKVYQKWSSTAGSSPPRQSWTASIGPGSVLLAASGAIVAGIIAYGIFAGDFLASLAKPEHARGLITFLFAFSAIAIILVIAIAIFWVKKEEIDDRFGKAKDLLTIVIGVLGTILGFYFGSLAGGENGDARMPSVANVTVSNPILTAGDRTTISATVLGGPPTSTRSCSRIRPVSFRLKL
ncbi:hypothetical protein [Microvirga zambiensis]|uniref:hypothetical protein n=1 Tax=Microvirga zambiensis TaxID=1402137 RepID=UPI00191F9831|nr:hypothetical protein [Microvirga zambiensis]